jgi:hypothetical protein
LATVFEACKQIFAVRFLREAHCVGSTIASADEILSEAESVVMSGDSYLKRCKQLNGYDARWDGVIERHDGLLQKMNGDFRNYINIHDLGEILASVVRSLKSRTVHVNSDFVAKHCSYVLLSRQDFGYPLFGEIAAQLTEGAKLSVSAPSLPTV